MAYADFSRFVVTAANEPSARSPRIRCTPFPSIHLLHLLGSYKWQLYGFVLYGRLTKQSPALYAVSVRQARGLLTASFRFFLAEDTLAVQLYASSLPRRIRDFHPLGRAHGAHTIKKAALLVAAQFKLMDFYIVLMVLVVFSTLNDGNLIFISLKNHTVLFVNPDAGKPAKSPFSIST